MNYMTSSSCKKQDRYEVRRVKEAHGVVKKPNTTTTAKFMFIWTLIDALNVLVLINLKLYRL